MTGRILLVTSQQALRSIVLTLFPIAFLALVGWASAGSATGNTSDPIRAAIWFWLGAHLVPFKLALAPSFTPTMFSYLPIAAIILPFLAIRSGFKRSVQYLGNERAARSFLTLWYVIFATLAALFVQGESVKPVTYLVPIYVAAISLIATVNYSAPYFNKFKLLGFALITLSGLAFALFAISLVIHFKVVNNLATVIQPGWIGGIYLLLIQILYLPNLVISAFSYAIGIGFSIGLHTQIDPFTFKLRSLPAIPILGGLPTGKNNWALCGLIILILIFALNQLSIVRDFVGLKSRHVELIKSIFPVVLVVAIISFLAQGSLITNEMSPIGPIWWKIPLLLLIIPVLLAILGIDIPAIYKKIRGRS